MEYLTTIDWYIRIIRKAVDPFFRDTEKIPEAAVPVKMTFSDIAISYITSPTGTVKCP
jgi:hypothetical protein